jgi:hypothetical protein
MKTAILFIEERDWLEKVLSNLTRGPRLKKINFLDCGLDEDLLATFRDISDNVRLQELVHSPYSDFGEQEIRLITSFSDLHILGIFLTERVKNMSLPSHSITATSSLRHLRTLRICAYTPEQLLRWFNENQFDFTLETFDLRVLGPPGKGWGPVAALNSFLRRQKGDLTISARYLSENNRSEPVMVCGSNTY